MTMITPDAGGRIAMARGKVEALDILLAQAGLSGLETRGEAVLATLAAIGAALGPRGNANVGLRDSADIAGVSSRLVAGRMTRTLSPPRHLSGMPECFTDQSPVAHTPDFRVLTVPGGYFCHYRDG